MNLDEAFIRQVQNSKSKLKIDESNLDIFFRIIKGEKVNLCVSNLFDIFKLSTYFKSNDILELLDNTLLKVSNIGDICYILLNKPISKEEEKYLLKFLKIGKMGEKLSNQIDEFIKDCHFIDFPTSSIFQILLGCTKKGLINHDHLYRKILTSISENLCLLPFIDAFELVDEEKQELFSAIQSIEKKCENQEKIRNEINQESSENKPENDEILKLQKANEKYLKERQEREEIMKNLKQENEKLKKQLLKENSNNVQEQSENSNDVILKLQKIIEKQNRKFSKKLQEKEEMINKMKEENDDLKNQIANINHHDNSGNNIESNDEISNLHKIIENLKKEQNERDEIINKLKEDNDNLIKQSKQEKLEPNSSFQFDENEIADLYNLCTKYKSDLEKEQKKSEEKDETIQTLEENKEKYKEAFIKEKEKNDFNTKLISDLTKENEQLKKQTNENIIDKEQPPINAIIGRKDKYHPPTSPKELKRIETFKENESIVENGFYTYKDKITHKNVTKFIKKDLDKSISQTEIISSTTQLKIDAKSLSKHEKLSIFQRIDVWEATTFYEAIYMKKKVSNKVCVLNFASSTQPGGGVLNGRNAQEETLSRQSFLYFSLNSKREFYEHNKKFYDPFGTDYMIYSPNVMIIRDDNDELIEPVKVSIISAVAVNYSEIKQKYKKGEKDQAVYDKMKNRCRRILKLCLLKGNDIIILGAFGCGVFQNSPKMISEIFKELLVDESIGINFKKIIFAIKTKPGTSNETFQIFKNTLSLPTKKF